MLVYPQLATGALCQFPVRKSQRTRTVTNRAPDGSTIKLADPAAQVTEWRLEYANLSDQEAAALRDFFTQAEGSLNGFTFLDPAGNLLAWSEQLDAEVWQKDPLLAITGGVSDPLDSTRAWRLVNNGGAAQALAQTLAGPGDYQYCLSAYVRAAAPATVELIAGSQSAELSATAEWSRIVLIATGEPGAASVRFGIAAGAGATVEVFGLQVEAQGGASVYKASTRGGVYSDSHLGGDELRLTCTSINQHSCTVNIIHANHL
jgi:hypothetical protein